MIQNNARAAGEDYILNTRVNNQRSGVLTDLEYRENITEILQVGRWFFILKHLHNIRPLLYLFVTIVIVTLIYIVTSD